MKKIVSVLAAIILVFCFSVNTFAETVKIEEYKLSFEIPEGWYAVTKDTPEDSEVFEYYLYYDGTMADVESMIRILENNGWTMLYNNETDTQYEVIYMNAMGAMVSFTFSSAGIDAPEGRTYPICVVLIV